MNARERNAYERYMRSTAYSLYDVYDSFSKSKSDAWEYCRKLCMEKRGGWLKIISANTFQFTAGFEYEENGKRMFMYITKTSDTACEIERSES